MSGPQRLRGVALLAARTARSQAYIQTLVANGLHPDKVIIMGEPVTAMAKHRTGTSLWEGITLPDLGEPVIRTCERAGIDVVFSRENDVNAEGTKSCLRDAAPEIVIYSGVGGQTVAGPVLDLGPKFLHLHSGWLPEFRGSTTLYYALLDQQLPGVTALLLDRGIDTGPILVRQHYPKPCAGLDLDLTYDSAIRADLLARVMRGYLVSGALPVPEEQKQEPGRPYYVIHPVLKHVAKLSLAP